MRSDQIQKQTKPRTAADAYAYAGHAYAYSTPAYAGHAKNRTYRTCSNLTTPEVILPRAQGALGAVRLLQVR